jgi:cytidine deaminase
MERKRLEINYTEYASKAEMPAADAALLAKAEEMTRSSYAPYSDFHVGAAVRMASGEVYGGANQENAAFPSGLCAERTALYYASAQHPDGVVEAIAIAAEQKGSLTEDVVTPCGACRQALVQYEVKSSKPIKVILGGKNRIVVFDSVADLLPLVFDSI